TTIPAGRPPAGATPRFAWRFELLEKALGHAVWYFERLVNAFGKTGRHSGSPLLIRANVLIRTEIYTPTLRTRPREDLVRQRVHDINAGLQLFDECVHHAASYVVRRSGSMGRDAIETILALPISTRRRCILFKPLRFKLADSRLEPGILRLYRLL